MYLFSYIYIYIVVCDTLHRRNMCAMPVISFFGLASSHHVDEVPFELGSICHPLRILQHLYYSIALSEVPLPKELSLCKSNYPAKPMCADWCPASLPEFFHIYPAVCMHMYGSKP